MRIMHIISSPSAGGAEIYVKDLAIAMAEKNHDVLVLFLNRAADIGRDIGFEKEFLSALAEKKIRYEFIGYRARKNPLFGMYRLYRASKSFRPDIIHCHLYYAAVFALATRGAKIIYTHHNIKLLAPAAIYQLLDLRMATYIGICGACKLMLQQVTRKPVVRIDNAVGRHRIITRAPAAARGNQTITVLVVGRLSEQKNLTLLLLAVAQLDDLDFVVKIAGEGPDRTSLEKQVKHLNLVRKIEFIGNAGNVPALMSQADIYAMSSAYEGLPIALIEATLSGLPVIVTNVGGCGEVIQTACNGIVIDDPNPNAYAAGLRRLIESKELRDRFSSNALKNSHRYHLDTAVNAHLRLYDSLAFPAGAK